MTEIFNKYVTYLELNYKAINTINTYRSCAGRFLKDNPRPYRATKKDLISYMLNIKNNQSVALFNQSLSALRILYIKVLKQPHKLSGINYLKKDRKCQDILSVDEVKSLIDSVANLKHKTIITLLYVGGLRISELLSLKVKDIDSANNRLIIRTSKGNKGRHVPLLDNVIKGLRKYYLEYRPKVYLIEGQNKGKYSASSVRSILNKHNKTSKNVHPHLLRHSAITHLIDNGNNHVKVQLFAGHASSKSTLHYYHLSKNSLQEMALSI